MRVRVIAGILTVLAVLGLLVFMLTRRDQGWNLVGLVLVILGGLFATGLVVRFVCAEPGHRLRETFKPIVDAGDVYQKLLMGRPTADESLYEASKYVSRDKYSSEE